MLPFEGLVVLDFAGNYPGAFTTMFLGDFGAEVIRIDRPPAAPAAAGVDLEELAAYTTVARNKRSIIVDMKSDDGQAVLRKLVAKADILLEGFRPDVMARLSADYATLSKVNPRLIYCSLSGFGTSGPYVKTPAHDMNYISLGGVLSLIGERGGYPVLPSNFIADIGGAALHGLVGILTALHARERTGRGQHVDIAYLDSVVSLLALEAPTYFRTGRVPRRGETRLTGADPWTHVYKCADGEYITVACIEPHFWDNLCRLLGHEEFIKFQRSPYPQEELDAVSAEMADIFITRSRDEWFEFFTGEDVCFGPVHYLDETFADPQVLHRGMVAEKEHPRLGTVKQVGLPVKLSDTPARIESLGVPAGTNTAEILGELGYSDAEINRLTESGAVTRWEPA